METLKTLSAIEYLLNIHWNGQDCEDIRSGAQGWNNARQWLLENELIEASGLLYKTWKTTERGAVYVEAIRDLPLPVKVWSMRVAA